MRGINYKLLRKMATVVLCALQLTGLTLCFDGCATQPKSLIMAYPNYFEINKGQTVPVAMDKDNIQKVIPSDMSCYDAQAQLDVLAAKKGVK